MAMRLSHAVVAGELYNRSRNSVHGQIALRGVERNLVLQLTGNFAPDLAGKCIRFEARDQPAEVPADEEERLSPRAQLAQLDLADLRWDQSGPVGMMTAARQASVLVGGDADLQRCLELGVSPQTVLKPCLYLEWFSRNGRVVVELVDPIIEIFDPDDEREQARRKAEMEEFENHPFGGATSVTPTEELDLPAEEEDAVDGGGLIPRDLQREFDRQAQELDRAIRPASDTGADDDDVVRDLELMDHLIESGDGEPLMEIFDETFRVPSPDQVDEQQAEDALRMILAKLALRGVSLVMCTHLTMKDAYRITVERICREQNAYPELASTSWVQYFDMADYCPKCQEELGGPI